MKDKIIAKHRGGFSTTMIMFCNNPHDKLEVETIIKLDINLKLKRQVLAVRLNQQKRKTDQELKRISLKSIKH